MSEYTITTKKLTFKGESKKKRKRKDPETSQNNNHEDDGDPEGWTFPTSLELLSGPLILISRACLGAPLALSCDPIGKLFTSKLSENLEPEDVRQVWVITTVGGTEKFALKSHTGKYLSVDKFGSLTANTEAIGLMEAWSLERVTDNGWTLKSKIEKYVSIGKVQNGYEIRGDSEHLTENEIFILRVQKRFLKRRLAEAKKVEDQKKPHKVSRSELERLVGKKLTDERVKELRKADKEGLLNEALLDLRVKKKNDRYAG
ncbi:Protein frg1 [Neolecta irregularis DAH-3]|uniref:Protein frg1 n=1 Tax=Neolecta irregularis (strain DAH-3) TaxID=1198029 RepID=A0A1U7LWS7_NEOID|nr:Protein frg1 [Neolecta irregularis DAH-3]|eukprot:OLL27135.1 Protein frg1 [Neolecta irregularis DAH-3]